MTKKSWPYRLFKFLWKLLAFTVLIVLIAAIAGFLYVNNKKDQLAQRSLRYVNQEIAGTIEVGSIHIASLFTYPEIVLKLDDVNVYQPDSLDDQTPVIHVDELNVSANLNEVLNNHFDIDFVQIDGGFLHVKKDTTGSVNISTAFYSPPIPDSLKTDSSTFYLGIDSIHMTQFNFMYDDRILNKTVPIEIDDLKGDLVYANSEVAGYANIKSNIEELDLSDSLKIPDLPFKIKSNYSVLLKDRKVKVGSKSGQFGDIPFYTDFMYDYGEVDNMDLTFNTSGKGVLLKEDSFLTDTAQIKESIHLLGYVNFETHTTWRSNPNRNFLNNMNVSVGLSGKDLNVIRVDIDALIEKFKRSQNFNLLDVSAVLLAGPFGLAVTKGADYTVLALGKAGDSCYVRHFESDWVLKEGVLSTSDVALSTENNLVAIGGWYDLNKEKLDFNIHLVDRHGCSLMTQRYYGESKEPQAGRVKVLKTFFGPVRNLFRDIGMSNCDIVYSGMVEHPEVTAKREKKEAKQQKKADRKAKKQEK